MAEVVDYIIVGQGLAGSCLALQLRKCNKKLLVIDLPLANKATAIAAGLFNPVTGKVMTKTWKADVLFDYLHVFYRDAEEMLGGKFFHPMPLYRPFVSVEEQNEWMAKSADAGWRSIIEKIHLQPIRESEVHNPFGGLLLKSCGYLNTQAFCKAVREYLQATDSYREEYFDESNVVLEESSVTYKNYRASALILCQGTGAIGSRFSNGVPVRPLKGETLTIDPAVHPAIIYNRGVYVVPDSWKVGATYSAADKSEQVTDAGRRELVAKLDELVRFPYRITNHQWGMRPTSPDRRPMLGRHPAYSRIVFFNGLGTKGVSLAPYFSGVLADWLEKGQPLEQEVDINRYNQYIGNLL